MLRRSALSRLQKSTSILPDYLALQFESWPEVSWGTWVRGVKVQANEVHISLQYDY